MAIDNSLAVGFGELNVLANLRINFYNGSTKFIEIKFEIKCIVCKICDSICYCCNILCILMVD